MQDHVRGSGNVIDAFETKNWFLLEFNWRGFPV